MTEQQIIVTLAIKVMGWEVLQEDFFNGMNSFRRLEWFETESNYPYFSIDEGEFFLRTGRSESRSWNPLQNIADAWQLMEKLRQRYFCEVVMTEGEDGEDGYYHWMARFTEVLESPYQVNRFKTIEKTAPATISKAAYKLVAEHNGNFRKGTEA
ncbi:hypothetical protein C4A75_09310 [Brevibacillus laterosporus]|uniref:BC1872 family protein n=1 Tax=Brevibacillus laterosporus TaxID=1465 RepID=UPI000CE4E2CE|nr:hypothetical protein [Brevibacillus laterosporus]PPA84965.1 hypothetical protein C4A75_09310 [Brevibacillus laterosporus]